MTFVKGLGPFFLGRTSSCFKVLLLCPENRKETQEFSLQVKEAGLSLQMFLLFLLLLPASVADSMISVSFVFGETSGVSSFYVVSDYAILLIVTFA